MIHESEVTRLRADYARFAKERDAARKRDEIRLVESYENSMSRIEDKLAKDDLSPWEDR